MFRSQSYNYIVELLKGIQIKFGDMRPHRLQDRNKFVLKKDNEIQSSSLESEFKFLSQMKVLQW